MIVLQQVPEALEFANGILGVRFTAENSRWISSVDANGYLLGVVVLSRFTPWNCELSVASVSPRFLSRALIRATFDYVFGDLGLRRVTAVVEADNQKALDMDQRLGFVREAVLQGWYGEKDGIMLRMLREECRWITR